MAVTVPSCSARMSFSILGRLDGGACAGRLGSGGWCSRCGLGNRGSLDRSGHGGVLQLYLIIGPIHIDGEVFAFGLSDGYFIFFAVDLEVIFFHILGIFLKLRDLLFHPDSLRTMVTMPGSTSWTVSLR